MFFSSRDLRAAVLLASATLLASSPLHAATKTTPAKTAKAHVVYNSKATSSKASSQDCFRQVLSVCFASRAQRRPESRSSQAQVARTAGHRLRPHPEIQQALIREHYLDGEATGEWDQATRDALTRFQSDNHWQTKIVPDARALIKLGLGPSRQNLLNPESAAMAPAYQPVAEKSVRGGSN